MEHASTLTGLTPSLRRPVGAKEAVFMAVAVLGILATRGHSYLLFHTLVEFFNICVVLTAFSLAWNTRHHLEDDFLRVAGLAMGPSAIVTLLHTLTYKGMGGLGSDDANLPTQLWVVLRTLQAGALLAATLPAITRRRNAAPLAVSALAALVMTGLIFLELFPDCYVDGQGLTPFKIAAESLCMVVMAVAAWRMARDRSPRHPLVRKLAVALLLFGALESAAFTLYVDVYGVLNMLGHVLALAQSFLLYSAIAWVGLTMPLETLFAQQTALRTRFEKDAARAQDDMARFGEILAHHLQEPVRQQHVFTQALAKALPQPLPAAVAQPLELIMAGAMRQRALLHDALLYLSLAEPPPAGARGSARSAVESVAVELQDRMAETGASLRYDKLPKVAVAQKHLKELFLVLVDNALSYRRPGVAPVVEIVAQPSETFVQFCVRDNGIGIPPDMRDKAFGIFERLSNDGHGTGIGLAVASRIVGNAGGRIWIEDSPLGGTTIAFTLPAG